MMSAFYNKVLKMREQGKSLRPKSIETKREKHFTPKTVNEETEKPKETAVVKNDKRTGRKA